MPIKLTPNKLAPVLLLTLSGCMGIYEGGFECPPGKGVGCKSVSEVNEMVNQGLGTQTKKPDKTSTTKCTTRSCSQLTTEDPPTIWYAPWVLEI